MLTRLKVQGFKNIDIDVRLGPFTCIAGANGIGKSNVFDAIAFLSALADKSLIDAALSVRGGAGRTGDVRSLFRRTGDTMADEMHFLVEMIIPERGEDDLGQPAEASMTYLQYRLGLRYRGDSTGLPVGGIELVHEDLKHLNKSSAKKSLGFPSKRAWVESVIQGRRTSSYISTEHSIVSLHADAGGGTGGRPRKVPAHSLPRTMLSSVNNAAEHRTLVLARQEMKSWMELQLEPSALRSADPFTAPHTIGASGDHLPATLYHLAHSAAQREPGGDQNLYARVANRLSELIENVGSISVDVDERRQLLNVVMTDLLGTPHVAGSLSDGTLRFLALTVMEADSSPRALICLEEPENGMHPSRIRPMLRLLQEIAVDPTEPVGPDNPLRQVIINTHSPLVVAEVPDDALLFAHAAKDPTTSPRATMLSLAALPDTWRNNVPVVSRGALLDYLNPLQDPEDDARDADNATEGGDEQHFARRRVKDRKDLQMLLPLFKNVN
ncbi:MAG: AAA family ATPase [Polyangiaceae bacterium]|nr:AAA family ATPase [Polyangiaceae bacterium]